MTMSFLTSQRGAMFGLDARIALAIFGGLSVVTGAALFGVSKTTRVTALATEFDNISKAYTSMILDTATNPGGDIEFDDMLTNGDNAAFWNGPYLTRTDNQGPGGSSYALQDGQTTDGQATPPACAGGDSDTSQTCFIWLAVTGVDESLYPAIDLAVDGVEDADSGNIRYPATAGADDLYYAIMRNPG